MPTTITGSTGVSKVQDGVITVEDLNGGGSGSAPVFGCRAWVNFDGTKDSTGAASTANTNRLIRSSGNVTSVLRNSVGNYTVTFTTAMPDANYAVSGSITNVVANTSARVFSCSNGEPSVASSVGVLAKSAATGAAFDEANFTVSIFR